MNEFVINPWLTMYADADAGGALVIEDLRQNRRVSITDADQFETLVRATDPTTLPSLVQAAIRLGLDEAQATAAVEALVAADLLLPVDSAAVQTFRKVAPMWHQHGWWDAFMYAAATRDESESDPTARPLYLDYDDPQQAAGDRDRMSSFALREPPSPVFKDYLGANRIELPDPRGSLGTDTLDAALCDPLFEANAQTSPLSALQLSAVLMFGFGRTGWVEFVHQGRLLLKAVPSGGARHPAEAYLITLDTELPTATYHYSVRHHALERIANAPGPEGLAALIPEYADGVFAPKAILVMSAKLERSMWRYRDDPRSYRVVLHDLGHILEVFKFAAKAVGVRVYYGHAMWDEAVVDLLRLDADEPPLKFAALA